MMTATIYIVAVALSCILVQVEMMGSKSGPFDVEILRAELCENEGTKEIHFGPKISSKGNGIRTYTNDVYFLVPWDDKIKMDIELQQLNNGVYRPRYLTQTFKNCEKFMKLGIKWATDFFKAADYELKGCPIPVGNYSVKDWVVKVNIENIPTMMYNSYKGIATFTREGKRVGCIMVFANVIPKSS